MAVGYTDEPHNIAEIAPYVTMVQDEVIADMFGKEKCYFYDTCSFRRHANLSGEDAACLLRYVKDQNGVIVITRCILMELASHSGVLSPEYISYIRCMKESGLSILLIYEEELFVLLEQCFSNNTRINEYLCWAVRMIKSPVGTIAKVLENRLDIRKYLIKGMHLERSDIYKVFFETVRKEKEAGDNLGEELIAVCLHVLSNLPGEPHGKFCVITDDKNAAGKIDMMFQETSRKHLGKKVGIFSTPKLVQILYREQYIESMEQMERMLTVGTEGNLIIHGRRIYDLRGSAITVSGSQLAEWITKPNEIEVIF